MNIQLFEAESQEIATLYGLNSCTPDSLKRCITPFLKSNPKVQLVTATTTHRQDAACKALPKVGFSNTKFIKKTQHQDTRLAIWTVTRKEFEKCAEKIGS